MSSAVVELRVVNSIWLSDQGTKITKQIVMPRAMSSISSPMISPIDKNTYQHCVILSDRYCFFIMLQVDEYIQYLCSPYRFCRFSRKEILLVGIWSHDLDKPGKPGQCSYHWATESLLFHVFLQYGTQKSTPVPVLCYCVSLTILAMMGKLHKTQFAWVTRLLICQIESLFYSATGGWIHPVSVQSLQVM
jgi:hypothetical protein